MTDDKNSYKSIRKDFEANLRFLSKEEGGRQTPWLLQGYRPDFSYADDLKNAFMIWPIFLKADGDEFEKDDRVSTTELNKAQMVIINDDLRKTYHRQRIKPGLKFVLREGYKNVAEGVVTRILDLEQD